MGSGVCRGPLPPGPYGPLLRQVLPKCRRGVLDVVALASIAAEAATEGVESRGAVVVIDSLWREALRDAGRDRPGPIEAFDLCSAALLLPLDASLTKIIVEARGLTMIDRLLKALGTSSTASKDARRIVLCESLDLWSRAVKECMPDEVCRKLVEAAEKRIAEVELPQHSALSLESVGWLALLDDFGGDARGLSTVARAAYCDGRLPLTVSKYAASVGGSTPFVGFVSVLLDCFGCTWIAELHSQLWLKAESLEGLKKPLKSTSEEEVSQMTEELLAACFACTRKVVKEGHLSVLADIVGALQGTSVKIAHHKATVDKKGKTGKSGQALSAEDEDDDDDDDADSIGSEGEAPALPSGERALPRLQSGPACAWQFMRLAIDSALTLKFPDSVGKLQVANMQRVLKVAVNGVADGPRKEAADFPESANQKAVYSKAAQMRRDARDLLKEVGDTASQLIGSPILSSAPFMLRQVGRDAWGLKGLVERLVPKQADDLQAPSKVKSLVGEDTSSDEGDADTVPLIHRSTASAGKLEVSSARSAAESPELPPPKVIVEHREESEDEESQMEVAHEAHHEEVPAGPPSAEATPLHGSAPSEHTFPPEDFSARQPASLHGLESDLLGIFEAAGGIPGKELIDFQDLTYLIMDDAAVAAFFGLPGGIEEGDENWHTMQELFDPLEKDLDGQISWEGLAEFFFKHIAPYVHIERPDVRGPTPSATHMSSIVSSESESGHAPAQRITHERVKHDAELDEVPVTDTPATLPTPVVLSQAQALALVGEDDSTVNDSVMVPPQTVPDIIEQPELASVRSRLQTSARGVPRQSPRMQGGTVGLSTVPSSTAGLSTLRSSCAAHAKESSAHRQLATAELPAAPVSGPEDVQVDNAQECNMPPTTMVPQGWNSGRGSQAALPSADAMRQQALLSGELTSLDAGQATAQGLPTAEAVRISALIQGVDFTPQDFHNVAPISTHGLPAFMSSGDFATQTPCDCAPVAVQASIIQVDQAVQAQPLPDTSFTEHVLQTQLAFKTSARAADIPPFATVNPNDVASQPQQSSSTSMAQVDQTATTELRLPQPAKQQSSRTSAGWPDAAEPSVIPVPATNSQQTSEADDNVQRLQEALAALQERTDRLESENSQLMRQLSSMYSAAEAPSVPQTEVAQLPEACHVANLPSQIQQQSSQCAIQTVSPEAASRSAQAPFSQLAVPSLLGSGPLVNISFGANGPDFNGAGAAQSRFGNDGYGARRAPEVLDIKSAVQRALAEERSQRLAVQAALAAAREWRTHDIQVGSGAAPCSTLSTAERTLTDVCPVPVKEVQGNRQRSLPPSAAPNIEVGPKRPRTPQGDSSQDVAGVVRNMLAGEIKEVATELRGVGQTLAEELRSACQSMQQSLHRQALKEPTAQAQGVGPYNPFAWPGPVAACQSQPYAVAAPVANALPQACAPHTSPTSWPPMPQEFHSKSPIPCYAVMPTKAQPMKPSAFSKDPVAAALHAKPFADFDTMVKPIQDLGPRREAKATSACRKERFERQLGDLDMRMRGLDARFRRLGST